MLLISGLGSEFFFVDHIYLELMSRFYVDNQFNYAEWNRPRHYNLFPFIHLLPHAYRGK